MTALNWFFFLLVMLIAILVSISFKSRIKLYYKVASLSLGIFAFFLIYLSLLEILSRLFSR